ncbi:MAG: hypothetical protein INQ03_11415 [Candidatus Heimdallarchaeota archaeon]|nr:hypothetical protein [Candidatus Heimdallarchaeota archaeon]
MRTPFLLLIIILLLPSAPVQTIASETQSLDFIFVLHANQALVPYGDVANDLNYHGVLETLREHPEVKITLHISGTLLSVLSFHSPNTLDLIKDGLADGQFELLGSTYAQNVMYSQYYPGTSDPVAGNFDNNLQIKLHKQILDELFDVTPTTFWNPERVWDPDLVGPIISDNGYSATFVEDHIIQEVSGEDEHVVRTTGSIENPLYIFSDDRDLIFNETSNTIGPVDKIARGPNSGDSSNFIEDSIAELDHYLNTVFENDVDDEKVVVYAQDMEAWGLWQEEGRIDDGGNWSDDLAHVLDRLDQLLTHFEQQSWLKLTHPSDVISSIESSDYVPEHLTIPFGEAKWMEHAALSAGQTSWKSWQDSSSSLNSYRSSFAKARDDLFDAQILIDSSSKSAEDVEFAKIILNYMQFIYAANQFEFGCWGVDFAWFNRVKTVGIGLDAISWILADTKAVTVTSDDLDQDGYSEYIMKNEYSYYAFSSEGGRLIAWFDLQIRDIIVYNDAEASYMEGGYANLQEFKSNIQGFWGRSTKAFALREKSFTDYPRYNFTTNTAESIYAYSLDANSIRFQVQSEGSEIRKTFELNDAAIDVHYEVTNLRSDEMAFSIVNYYAPSNLDLMFHNSLSIVSSSAHQLGVRNDRTGVIAGMDGSQDLIEVSKRKPGMFSLGLEYKFTPIPGESTKEYTFRIRTTTDSNSLGSDNIQPVITVHSPLNNTSFYSLLEFNVTATDNIEISRIELIFDNEIVEVIKGSGILYFYQSGLDNGWYTFIIRAVDMSGNINEVIMILEFTGGTSTAQDTPFYSGFLTLIAISIYQRRPRRN